MDSRMIQVSEICHKGIMYDIAPPAEVPTEVHAKGLVHVVAWAIASEIQLADRAEVYADELTETLVGFTDGRHVAAILSEYARRSHAITAREL